MKIVVIDYQLGNISSIINMLKKIGVKATHSNDINEIKHADKLILPGVGAFDHGMHHLHESGLVDVLNAEVLEKQKPILGICLGMQLLLEKSAEGKLPGLGWIKGECVKFSFIDKSLKVPHMGWNTVNLTTEEKEENRFYFVHSFHAACRDASSVMGTTLYGYEFPAIIKNKHIMGAQFHPEKSHKFGMRFLQKFIEGKL